MQAEHLTRLSDLRLLVLAEGSTQANVTSGSQPLTILQVGGLALSIQALPQLSGPGLCKRRLQAYPARAGVHWFSLHCAC